MADNPAKRKAKDDVQGASSAQKKSRTSSSDTETTSDKQGLSSDTSTVKTERDSQDALKNVSASSETDQHYTTPFEPRIRTEEEIYQMHKRNYAEQLRREADEAEREKRAALSGRYARLQGFTGGRHVKGGGFGQGYFVFE